jgi:hypothetical protein
MRRGDHIGGERIAEPDAPVVVTFCAKKDPLRPRLLPSLAGRSSRKPTPMPCK